MILHRPGNNTMKDFGLIGFLTSALSFVVSEVFRALSMLSYPIAFLGRLKVETLQEIALYVSIIAGFLTIMWHLGNMMMREDEFFKALKSKIKRFISKKKQSRKE